MYYRELAPISSDAWEEMDERAEEVIKSHLSARKVVRVRGPMGIGVNVLSEGRLVNIREKQGVHFGTYHVLPLIEARVEFEMKRWELDNIARGARDVDYEPLEIAARSLALFEEDVVYHGLEEGGIQGLNQSCLREAIAFGEDIHTMMAALSKGLVELTKNYQKGPFDLIVGEQIQQRILSVNEGYPFDRRIEELIGGKIFFNHLIQGAYLLPHDHENLELSIGQDYSLGYQSHDNERVRFFISESFTFRVLDPSLIIKFKL